MHASAAPLEMTAHAQRRAKERMGLDAKALERTAALAFTGGLKHGETCGQLRRYMDRLHTEHGTADNLRIYGEHVFIFCRRTLVTILHLPNEFKAAAANLRSAKTETTN